MKFWGRGLNVKEGTSQYPWSQREVYAQLWRLIYCKKGTHRRGIDFSSNGWPIFEEPRKFRCIQNLLCLINQWNSALFKMIVSNFDSAWSLFHYLLTKWHFQQSSLKVIDQSPTTKKSPLLVLSICYILKKKKTPKEQFEQVWLFIKLLDTLFYDLILH